LHLPVAMCSADANKPLLLEKPLARTFLEGRALVDHFSARSVPLMIAQTLRFDPLVLALKRRLAELGGLRGFPFEHRLEPRGLAWEDEPETSGGGVLVQTGIHTIDALRTITGASTVEVRYASFARMQYRNNEDHASLILALSGGPSIAQEVEVEGTLGI